MNDQLSDQLLLCQSYYMPFKHSPKNRSSHIIVLVINSPKRSMQWKMVDCLIGSTKHICIPVEIIRSAYVTIFIVSRGKSSRKKNNQSMTSYLLRSCEKQVESGKERRAQATGMVSSWLATFHIRVLVWSGILGSLLISSKIDMAEAALTASFIFGSTRMVFALSAERRIFLGTASSFMMRSKTSMHCLRTFSAVVESPPFLWEKG